MADGIQSASTDINYQLDSMEDVTHEECTTQQDECQSVPIPAKDDEGISLNAEIFPSVSAPNDHGTVVEAEQDPLSASMQATISRPVTHSPKTSNEVTNDVQVSDRADTPIKPTEYDEVDDRRLAHISASPWKLPKEGSAADARGVSDDEGAEVVGFPASHCGTQPIGSITEEADSLFIGLDEQINGTTSPEEETPPLGPITPNMRERILEMQRSLAARYKKVQAKDTATRQPQNSASVIAPTSTGTKQTAARRVINDAEAAEFEKLRQGYVQKLNTGTLTTTEEIDFKKAQSKEQARIDSIFADEDYDNREDYVPEESAQDMDVFNHQFNPDVSILRPKKRTTDGDEAPPRKRARKNKIAGRDYTGEDIAKAMNAGKKAARAKKGQKKGEANKQRTAPTMSNTASLWTANIFKDAAAVQDLPDQPMIEKVGFGRNGGLTTLVASVRTGDRKIAQVDRKYLDAQIRHFTGKGSVMPATDGSGNWTMKGMRTTLKHYQVLGTAFMREQENRMEEPRGGIQADQMGLGKTIMMLANIVNGMPERTRGIDQRCTLVVASTPLLQQWAQEIEKHCWTIKENKHGIKSVAQVRAGSRPIDDHNKCDYEKYDIILTTYHEVSKSYPKDTPPTHLTTSYQRDSWWRDHFEKHRGILHRMRFHRVVLDEAQAIKNHLSQSAKACTALNATHRWLITGTPVLNSPAEFYSLFKFLRVPHCGSYKIFNENFCSTSDPVHTERLNALLESFMVRRVHQDTLFGAKLLSLPRPTEKVFWLHLNSVERNMYEVIRRRFIYRINSMVKDGTSQEKQCRCIWTMILRLRQFCCHWLLTQESLMDLLESEDFEMLEEIIEREKPSFGGGRHLLIRLRKFIEASKSQESTEATLPMEEDMVADTEHDFECDIGGSHGQAYDHQKYLTAFKKTTAYAAMQQRAKCRRCHEYPRDSFTTSCGHLFCESCLEFMSLDAAKNGFDEAICPACGQQYASADRSTSLDDSAATQEQSPGTFDELADFEAMKEKQKAKLAAKDKWYNLPGDIAPSAKTYAVKAQIINWMQEDPEAKIIIYTQFVDMIFILSKVCAAERWQFCKYHGSMSHTARANALKEFEENPAKKILICSLKCGGLGLNLTSASFVINIDPWWNEATEQQAFARVYRIGQRKRTYMSRFVIKDTIDEKMMHIKARKAAEIELVMEAHAEKRNGARSTEDLMQLFGRVGKDAQGKAFIFTDDPEDMGDSKSRTPRRDKGDEELHMGTVE